MTLTQNKGSKGVALIAGLLMTASGGAWAAGGGLNEATSQMNNIKTWGVSFLAVLAVGYILYNIGMAYLGRKGWGEVAMAVIYAAIAGAATTLGAWALGIWGG